MQLFCKHDTTIEMIQFEGEKLKSSTLKKKTFPVLEDAFQSRGAHLNRRQTRPYIFLIENTDNEAKSYRRDEN